LLLSVSARIFGRNYIKLVYEITDKKFLLIVVSDSLGR
jgi:hypothetical protein